MFGFIPPNINDLLTPIFVFSLTLRFLGSEKIVAQI